jgi:hypothetical protein
MRKLFPVVFPLMLLALTFSGTDSVRASIPTLTPGAIILTDRQGEYPLRLHLEILGDLTGLLTIKNITSREEDIHHDIPDHYLLFTLFPAFYTQCLLSSLPHPQNQVRR